jgi:hypothetical protein
MRKVIVLCSFIAGVMLFNSCGNSLTTAGRAGNGNDANVIKQQDDGTISLNLANADCYSDVKNPSCNTAEWNVNVSKKGRYNIWLSSATKDTNDLNYKNAVMVSVQDLMIEGRPECDRIVYNSSDVKYPWFRADSFIGAMYIQDTGVFHVQINSEQILPKDINKGEMSAADLTKLISVSFTPAAN